MFKMFGNVVARFDMAPKMTICNLILYQMGPTLIIVHLNCCIIIVYRRTCARRRSMLTKAPTTSQLLVPSSGQNGTNVNGSHHGGSSPTVITTVTRDGAVSFVSTNGSDRNCHCNE